MFENADTRDAVHSLLEGWTNDPGQAKRAFTLLKDRLLEKENAILSFKARPGVSFSLRATVASGNGKARPLFVMVDVIDDDPENRWLSICFYEDMITDPDEAGDLVPEGLLGEDGYCFDLYEYDESMISYIADRIDEAHAHMGSATRGSS